MGLLFQPRRMASDSPATRTAQERGGGLAERTELFQVALEAAIFGDASSFEDLFTDDVAFTCPHLSVTSRAAVQRAFGVPEDSLSDASLVMRSLDSFGPKVVAEWQLDATFSGPILFDDDVLIEPTGRRVKLRGVSVAEFRDDLIAAFRHYFDDSELLDQMPGVSSDVRWASVRSATMGN